MSMARSILRGCSIFSRASAFIRSKRGLHAFRLCRKRHEWELTQRRRPEPPDSPTAPLCCEGRLAGLLPKRMRHGGGTTTATGWMKATPSILIPHLPPLLPPKKERGVLHSDSKAANPLPTQTLVPRIGTSHPKEWGPSKATFALPECSNRPKHTHLNRHGGQ